HFTCSVGDATDEASYLTQHDPDIILTIGLFPYLPNDDAVRVALRLIFRHLSAGGCFICTTLTSASASLAHWEANGSVAPTVRTPEKLTQWLRAAGFIRIRERFSQPNGVALIAWKPG